MTISRDIVQTYWRPRAVFHRHLSEDARESRALFYLMLACGFFFVSQWPALARVAHLQNEPLNPKLGGALLAWIFIAPLLLYGFAMILHLLTKLAGGSATTYQTRLVLFWALLAGGPLVLLHGLVQGFIGEGAAASLVGLCWLGAVLAFLFIGMREAAWRKT